MYFTKIRLTGLHIVDLPIVNASSTDKYILKDVDGLGPPDVDVSMVNTTSSKSFFQSKNPQVREVVLRVGLNPNYSTNETVADLRTQFYGFLTPGGTKTVRIELLNDTEPLVYLTGYTKRIEIAPFSQTPELQITIVCVEKYLTSPERIYLSPESLERPVIVNVGTAPVGFHIEMNLTFPSTYWKITNEFGEFFRVDYPFTDTHRLIIDTTDNNKGVWVKEGEAEPVSIISGIAFGSTWLELHGGANEFVTQYSYFYWGDVYYQPQYWGI